VNNLRAVLKLTERRVIQIIASRVIQCRESYKCEDNVVKNIFGSPE
jgi:hypothetical protein